MKTKIKEQRPENTCPFCKIPFITKTEARQSGHFEVVDYCEKCGYTSTVLY